MTSTTPFTLNPKTDDDVEEFFTRLPDAEYLPTWYEPRKNGQLGPDEKAPRKRQRTTPTRPASRTSTRWAERFSPSRTTGSSSNTPPADPPVEENYPTRVELDIEGNQREVIDAKDRIVMRYDYDMLGNRIHSRAWRRASAGC